MTIQNLAAEGLVRLNTAPTTMEKRAVVFVLDESFLYPFKVLLFSLANTRSFLGLPVIIFTQDEVVYHDPIVKVVADRRIFIEDRVIEQFSQISSARVPVKHRLDWIPKYTFLKWLIFDEHGVDEILFIDADIVCLQNANAIFDEAPGYDLGICPMLKDSLIKNESKRPLPSSSVYKNLRRMIRSDFPDDHDRLNTGVMKLSGNCLSETFRRDLLKIASEREFVNEQSYITTLMNSDEGNYRFSRISSKYNFGAGPLSFASTGHQLQLLKDIVFLHFPGSKKPWLQELSIDSRLSHMIWWHYEAETRKKSRLLGG